MLKLVAALLAILGFIPLRSAFAASEPNVKLKAEPATEVMPEGRAGKAYVRISLKGVPYPQEGIRAPVNVALVIDKSGSMTGEKIEHAKDAAVMALDRLAPKDIIAVVAFNHEVQRLVPAGPYENVGEMRRRIAALRADGQTAIYAAVSQAAQELSEFKEPGRFNRVILLSDGQANVGPSTPRELEKLGRELGSKGISVTTLGLGLGYDEDLMSRLALASDGNHAFIEDPAQLVEIFNKEFGDILSVVGQDVEIIIICPDGIKPMRVLGREAQIDGQKIRLKLNQIYGAQEKYVVVELDVPQEKARDVADLAKVSVSYTDSRSKERVSLEGQAQVRFSASKEEVEKSVNKDVLAAITTQIATERNEKAVSMRDAGDIEGAKRELENNAAYIREQAEALGAAPAAAPLRELSTKNLEDAKSLDGADWEKQRKVMRYRQYQGKTQQKY